MYPFNKNIQTIAKGIGIISFLFCFSFNLFAQVSSNDIIGKWKNTKTSKSVEVYKTNDTYSAKIINAIDKSQTGKVIIWNFTFDKAKFEWNGGEVQLPNMAHSANCYIKLRDINTASITGYHGLLLFGSSEKYYREK